MFLLVGRSDHQNTLYESRSKYYSKHSGVLNHLFEAGIKIQDMDNNHILLETND